MTILCLCREQHHWKLIPGYADAFRRRGIEFFCVDDSIPFDASLKDVLRTCPTTPSAILHFESAHPLFPIGLERSEVPTVCFHPDTYAFTERRIHWSAVFDHAAVFHPVYKTRAELLPKLAKEFRTNDWSRPYTVEEVASVYRRSQIVVNIGRDDFPQDANLRVFEVLASGALLLTSSPTELTQLGFRDGVHFVSYRQPAELSVLVRRYLNDESARLGITEAARALVLAEHTYDRRADQLLARLAHSELQKMAPARSWPESHARLVALDFYAAHGLSDCAATQFRHIAGHGFRETIKGLSLLSRSWLKSLLPH
jgi:hypothetical protein